MPGPRSLSRRDLLRLGGVTLAGVLAGCQGVGGQNQGTTRTTTETTTSDPPTTTTTTAPSPKIIRKRPESTPWWVRRLRTGMFVDWDWPEGDPTTTLEVGTDGNPRATDTEDYRGIVVVNRNGQPTSVTVAISEQSETIHQADVQLAPDAYVGIGLFVPAHYRIQIGTAGSSESLSVSESEFGCNTHWHLVTIRSPTDINSEHGQTLLRCEAVTEETQ